MFYFLNAILNSTAEISLENESISLHNNYHIKNSLENYHPSQVNPLSNYDTRLLFLTRLSVYLKNLGYI